MANQKFYSVKETIEGKEYVAQFAGLSTALKAVDQSYIDGTANTSVEKLASFIFENIIVEPAGLTIDDFDSMEEFNKVVAFGRDVMQGKFRDEAKNKTADKK